MGGHYGFCNGITGGIVLTSHTVDPELTCRYCYDFLFGLCLSLFCFTPGLPLKPAPLYHSCTQPRTFLSFSPFFLFLVLYILYYSLSMKGTLPTETHC